MGKLVFVGLGLFCELDISLKGLEEIKNSDYVYAEFYTSLMNKFDLKKFESLIDKKIEILSRIILEEKNGEII